MDIPILDHVKAVVTVGNIVKSQNFFVVKDLITPVILGTDFLQEHRLLLDFSTTPVTVAQSETRSEHIQQQADRPQAQEMTSRLNTLWKAERVFKIKKCSVAAIEVEDAEDKHHTMVPEDCAIPLFEKPGKYELPQFIKPGMAAVVSEYQDLFITLPGTTLVASHQINTTGSPVRIPARRIPAHFRDEVEEQIQKILQKGIIVESSSPWLAPAVDVRKNSGEIRICVAHHQGCLPPSTDGRSPRQAGRSCNIQQAGSTEWILAASSRCQ